MTATHKFTLAVFTLISMKSMAQDNETVIRQMMCSTPRYYFASKMDLKKELNSNVSAALKMEGVKSLAELTQKASKSGLDYGARSILSEAVFMAAITDNRSALVDLAALETTLCKAKNAPSGSGGIFGFFKKKPLPLPNAAGCFRLVDSLNDMAAFQKTAKDHYDYMQAEKRNAGVTDKKLDLKELAAKVNEPLTAEDYGRRQTSEMMEAYKRSNRCVLETGAFCELKEMLDPKGSPVNNNKNLCVEKVAGALKVDAENYNPKGNIQIAPNFRKDALADPLFKPAETAKGAR